MLIEFLEVLVYLILCFFFVLLVALAVTTSTRAFLLRTIDTGDNEREEEVEMENINKMLSMTKSLGIDENIIYVGERIPTCHVSGKFDKEEMCDLIWWGFDNGFLCRAEFVNGKIRVIFRNTNLEKPRNVLHSEVHYVSDALDIVEKIMNYERNDVVGKIFEVEDE